MKKKVLGGVLFCTALAASPGLLAAQHKASSSPPSKVDKLQQEVKALKSQLQLVEKQLQQVSQDSKKTQDMAKSAQTKADDTQSQLQGVRTSALAAATTADNQDIKYRLSGSVVANWGDSTSSNMPSSFGGGAFMPIFLVRYKNLLMLEAHMEVANDGNETETSLEYAQLDLFLNDYMTLVAGKFLSPIGQFQQAIHPPWVNKLPDRPAGFVEGGGGEPLSEVGMQLTGAFPVGGNATMDYAFFVGNGPQMTEEGLTLEGFSHDNNSDKAFGGRIGMRPFNHFDMGVSAMRAKVPTNVPNWKGVGENAGYNLVDADFSYTPDNMELRGEYIHSHLKPVFFDDGSGNPPELTPDSRWNMWYLQAGYRLSGLFNNSSLRNVELVVRSSHRKVKGGTEDWRFDNENRMTFGVDYWFGPTMVAKFAYEHKTFQNHPNDNMLRAQLAYGF